MASLNRSDGGVPKLAVPEARVTVLGMEGDRQRELRYHGGPERALCLYALERIEALRRDGHPIAPGTTGENVTVEGLDWSRVVPGARLRVGEVIAEVTAYADPCRTVRGSFRDRNPKHISQRMHPGWSRVYARVLREGIIRAGDLVEELLRSEVRGPGLEGVQ